MLKLQLYQRVNPDKQETTQNPSLLLPLHPPGTPNPDLFGEQIGNVNALKVSIPSLSSTLQLFDLLASASQEIELAMVSISRT